MIHKIVIKFRPILSLWSRNPRTKTGWTEPGPRKVSKSGTEPDQNGEKFSTWDRIGPEPRKNSNSGTGPDQDQENLGPNRTRTENYFKTWDRTGPGPTKF